MTKTVLIVDDDQLVREAIGTFLRTRKFQVLEANGGHEALQILKSGKKVDVVVSDIQMPKGNGIELLKNISQEPQGPPVVLISGQSQTSQEEALQLGAIAFFQKPFDPSELVDCLNQYTAPLKQVA